MSRHVIDLPHLFVQDRHSGAGNCVCGMASGWRFHQPWWWRILHRRPWR